MRYRFLLEYDGGAFCGWQQQPGVPSVQSALESAAYALTQEQVTFVAAGRTDAGVHARGQVAHCDFLRLFSLDALRRGMNFYLKDVSVKVLHVDAVPETFHARFSARQRCYAYHLLNRPSPPVLEAKHIWWIARPLNIEAMAAAASLFEGHHNFSAFRARECQAKSSFKTVDSAILSQQGERLIFKVVARSFIHHQVRIMVGTLVEIGQGKRTKENLVHLLQGQPRTASGVTAPPQGLFFEKVTY